MVIAGCVLLHDGQIHDEGTAKLLNEECFPFGGVVHSANDLLPDPTSGWLSDEEENATSESSQEQVSESDIANADFGEGSGEAAAASSLTSNDISASSSGETVSIPGDEIVAGVDSAELAMADLGENTSTAINDSAVLIQAKRLTMSRRMT